MPVSDDLSKSILGEGLGLGGGGDTAGRYETWPHPLFSLLRLSGPHRGAISSTTALAVPPSAVDEISIHHSHSSQSISIYDREIRAKISVSVSISRFLRLENLLYTVVVD